LDSEKLKNLYDIYKKYKSEKRNFRHIRSNNGEETYRTIEQYNKSIRHLAYAISNNIQELANLAVVICYEAHPSDSKTFAWGVFGEGIIQNIEKNKQEKCFVPFQSDDGDINFMGKNYRTFEINTSNQKEDEIDEFDF
jgi:hypothetical protein